MHARQIPPQEDSDRTGIQLPVREVPRERLKLRLMEQASTQRQARVLQSFDLDVEDRCATIALGRQHIKSGLDIFHVSILHDLLLQGRIKRAIWMQFQIPSHLTMVRFPVQSTPRQSRDGCSLVPESAQEIASWLSNTYY